MRFRLWRTAAGVGNADAWVCVALSGKAYNQGLHGLAGRRSRRHDAKEATLTGAIAPTRPLTALDVCDRCGAQAYVRVLVANGGELLFCAYHGRVHAKALAEVAVDIQDETTRLSEPQPQ